MKQLFCVGLRNVIVLHILKPARMSGEQIIAYRPRHQTSFCFIISSQTPLPTSPLNRPRSQRSWLSHLSILNVPASAGCRFILTSTTVVYNPKMCFYHISLRWIKHKILMEQNVCALYTVGKYGKLNILATL